MAWMNVVNPFAIAPRRRVVATALMYGLSLSVRFTSAAGEETEVPGRPLHQPQARRLEERAVVERLDVRGVGDDLVHGVRFGLARGRHGERRDEHHGRHQ
jgi:hypothetical protein